MDDDWVRRTPSALLILPPPPQFADANLPLSRQRSKPPNKPMPVSPPSRSHTAAPAMRISRSHTAAPATRLARSQALDTEATTTETSRAEVACTSYATVAATPTHTTTAPLTHNTQAPPPAQQPTLPTIVVKRLPNWVGHFRTIGEALGHAPNARAHLKGVKFEPKSEEELRTIRRCLEEAAASDSAISFYEIPKRHEIPEATEKKKPPTPPKPTTHHITTPQGATRMPATAELGDVALPTAIPAMSAASDETLAGSNTTVPTTTPQGATRPPATAGLADDAAPKTIPAVSAALDETQAGTNTEESAVPLSRRRRRKRAPRPPLHLPAANTATRRSPLLPTPTAEYAPIKARVPYHDRHYNYQAPSSLDRTVRVILEALTTGIAAYLREQGAMPVPQHPPYHRAPSQEWRARAGEIPAQIHSPGK